MREIMVLRGDERRCREHAHRTMPKLSFFDDVDAALVSLRRERLARAVVYARDVGREAELAALGYFLRTELVP